jgi:glyoxylase-like metal-dependent hydrolase (beta-lactamase superfamily II)
MGEEAEQPPMKLVFLGTRGYIQQKSASHQRHSALLIVYRRQRLMIDCGEDWDDELDGIKPTAIILTHGHPDHAGGLGKDSPCPVYATEVTWEILEEQGVQRQEIVTPRHAWEIGGITLEAFPVEHSVRAPAVAYRVQAGRGSLLYAPDVVFVHDLATAMAELKLYIGDGATLSRSMVRKSGGKLIGHTPVTTQLGWCHKHGVAKAVFTHCGTEVVAGDEEKMQELVVSAGRARNVEAQLAHDGMTLILR